MIVARKEIIVSRHPAAVEFIRKAADLPEEHVPVVAEATEIDVIGALVYGNLPLHLAVLAAVVVAVEFRGTPPRGQEYTADDMRAAGAHLRSYVVKRGPDAILMDDGEDGIRRLLPDATGDTSTLYDNR